MFTELINKYMYAWYYVFHSMSLWVHEDFGRLVEYN